MRFWDSSALAAILLHESTAAKLGELLERDEQIAVWWATGNECWGALMRARRNGRRTTQETEAIAAWLDVAKASWLEIAPSDEIRQQARRVQALHPLRTADALQLAAAIVWSSRYDGAEFVTLDTNLRDAARIEGFAVV